LISDKIGDRVRASRQRLGNFLRSFWPPDQAAALELFQRSQGLDLAQSRDRFPAASHDNFFTLLDLLQVLAEAIVQISYADLEAAFAM